MIEIPRPHVVTKPWGIRDLRPWSQLGGGGDPIGEIWFDRCGASSPPSLRLKLLFTGKPLSIQVHPDDAYARSIGLQNGKTEAWYVLDAAPGARVALGVNRRLAPQELRQACEDGSIADLVVWHAVATGDSIFVPAGTIHAIGAGLVIAEIQQRSDATFRLYDHDRGRELHIADAVAVADTGPAAVRTAPVGLSDTRSLLVSDAHFTLERIDLAANSQWRLKAARESWLLVIAGGARTASFDLAKGDAAYAQADHLDLMVGASGLVALVGYTGIEVAADLLSHTGQSDEPDEMRSPIERRPTRVPQPTTHPVGGHRETVQ